GVFWDCRFRSNSNDYDMNNRMLNQTIEAMKNEYFACLYLLSPETKSLRQRRPDAAPGCHSFQSQTSSRLPHAQVALSSALARTYLRSLRAAEMAAWEMSGGDYLRSSFAA